MSRNGRKRLAVDIPKRIHAQLKEIGRRRNCTITKLVIRAVLETIIKENKWIISKL